LYFFKALSIFSQSFESIINIIGSPFKMNFGVQR
jgi:hypothetical protein